MKIDEYKDIIHRCFRCGYCKYSKDYTTYNCPAYGKFKIETYAPGGRLWLIHGMINGEVEMSPELSDILFSCTKCGSCHFNCPVEIKDKIVDMITAAQMDFVEKSIVPAAAKDFLTNVYTYGNPWKKSSAQRDRWAAGTGARPFDKNEYLLYIGDIASYDQRGQQIARSVSRILTVAGIDFGILGSDEISDGNDVFYMGEEGLFLYLADMNKNLFKERQIKKIITVSPHAYNIFVNKYDDLGANLQIYHYTHIVHELIESARIQFKRSLEKKVTYHDPCFLGRYNNQYEFPRKIIKKIPGVIFHEMNNNREDALCCGGGGGNYYTDLIGGGSNSPAVVRLKQAEDTRAELLVVTCPACMTMFSDAVNSKDFEGNIEVKDLSEVLCEVI